MKLDDIKKLHKKKGRKDLGCFLVEGEHLILELEKAAKAVPAFRQAKVYVSESYGDVATSLEQVRITDRQMQKIADTQTPQGIVAVVPFRTAEQQSAPCANAGETTRGKTIYLYEVQDPGNLGTILRTLAWFGGFRCVLSPNSVDPYNPKVVRASMGAIFHLPIELDVSLDELKTRFDHFACLDIEGAPLSSEGFTREQCFIFGNEARGVPHDELAGLDVTAYSIPGAGVLESLNLATAVNMCAYELNR
ncbi:RNA methyltransferase, TrmH family [Marinobacter persicus]|uniref:RNA methyltransferase, TrmH family n=1 Tax=Marinobacter persicus TaxID=930118 RepID=A0A1I3QRV8_9GAMM|nr:RNA methyltransferase [Marinobacter persicus]GHD42958.1 rRNA methyltransferase [Marinobacter persicus]SFJ36993.1 RNA methyltransferase, TrmH family [Marinobacter persicus]